MNVNLVAPVFAILAASSGFLQSSSETQKQMEPPRFWTAIANDQKLEPWRIGLAIHLLFERHVDQEISLGKLAKVLNKPTWITEKNVTIVTFIVGNYPLRLTKGDTMFSVTLFRNDKVKRDDKDLMVVCINVTGQIDVKDFVGVISGEKSKYENTKLRAWAIFPPWDSFIQRIPPD
jgi:hypothetical protein